MLTTFEALAPCAQAKLAEPPFDCWVDPNGDVTAEFRRISGGYHARFPGQADFTIALGALHVAGVPAPGTSPGVVETLYRNAIVPIIGNYLGGLNLHGSAVATPGGAIAFLGLSRSGKTTLAGAFARAGYPFLTEDALALEPGPPGYHVQPQRAVLRLFADSAAFLFGAQAAQGEEDDKQELATGESLPFCAAATPLAAICLLGDGASAGVNLAPLAPAEALRQLIRHAFVLDVEDRPRLAAHFSRLGELASTVPCLALDYPRSYAQLPDVIDAVLAACGGVQ